jgi:hypothetical protein
MEKEIVWEYSTDVIIISGTNWALSGELKEKLNKAGKDGWELVTALHSNKEDMEPILIFKRPHEIKKVSDFQIG